MNARLHPPLRAILLLAALCTLAFPVHAQEVLSNRHVVDLTRASVDPAVIVSTIESSRTSFGVGVEDIVALSNARVNRDVIAAMQSSVSRSGQPKPGMGPGATATVPVPLEFGLHVIEDGEASRLPLVAMRVDDSWTDGRGRPIRRVRTNENRTLQSKEVENDEPVFVLFRESPRNDRVRMYHLGDGIPDGAMLDTEIPLHVGPAGADPRMLKLVPGAPLPHGNYLVVVGEDFSRAYGFGRVRGKRNVPSLPPAQALAQARATPALRTPLAPADARALVLDVLARERIPVERDFDGDGLLITLRSLRGGLLGNSAAVQFAVVVEPSGAGSEIHVIAEAHVAGSPDGWLTGSDLSETPLIPAPEQSRRHADAVQRQIERALRRAAPRAR